MWCDRVMGCWRWDSGLGMALMERSGARAACRWSWGKRAPGPLVWGAAGSRPSRYFFSDFSEPLIDSLWIFRKCGTNLVLPKFI